METIARQVLGNSSKVRATSCIPIIYKCYRDRVMEIMREINPLAVGQRRRGRLHRRIYTSKVFTHGIGHSLLIVLIITLCFQRGLISVGT